MADDKKEPLELVGLLIGTTVAIVTLAKDMTDKQREPEKYRKRKR